MQWRYHIFYLVIVGKISLFSTVQNHASVDYSLKLIKLIINDR